MKLIRDGIPLYGIFPNEISDVNFKDYEYLNPLGFKIGKIKKHFAYNQFQYLGAVSEKLIFGVAIADLKYITNAFLYLYFPETKKLFSKSFKNPFSFGSDFTNHPETGTTSFRSGNKNISMSLQNQIKILEVLIPNELSMKINFDETKIQPRRICTKAGVNGWVYARKTAGSKVTGNIESKLGTFNLDELNMLGHNDFSMGFMRPETFWNWSLFMGEVDKNIFSVNLSAGVNETEFSENCCWMNGELFPLPQVSFQYDKKSLMKPWTVKSNKDDVRLEFIPEGLYQEKINAYILASNFNQVYGKYNGQIQLNDKIIEVKNFYGYAEDHYAKW